MPLSTKERRKVGNVDGLSLMATSGKRPPTPVRVEIQSGAVLIRSLRRRLFRKVS